MAGSVNLARLAILLEAEGAQQVIDHINSMAEAGTEFAGEVLGIAGGFAAMEKSMEFLKTSVEASAENEQMMVRLGQAVSNAGVNFATAKPAIDAMLESLGEKSTFSVDQLGEAFTRVVQLTGNVGKSMNAMGTIANFAAGRNIDLTEAANDVGRALNGNATQLNRLLGLHGTAAEAVAMLTKRYQGNAEALADTMGGAQTQATNAMHEFEEALGGVITNEGGAKEATLSWRDTIKDATTWVKAHREQIGNVVLGFTTLVRAIGDVVEWIKYPLMGAWIAANTLMYTVIATVESIIPTFKLMAANALISVSAFLNTVADMFPGLHLILDKVIKATATTGIAMAKEASAALAANADAWDKSIDALYENAGETEKVTKAVKDHAGAVAVDVEALLKEAAALAKLDELNVQSAAQFIREQELYKQLTALVEGHTLGLDDELKAREALAAFVKASPLLDGPAVLGMGPLGPGFDKDMAALNTSIVNGMKAGEKSDRAAAQARGRAMATSLDGMFFQAKEDLKDQHIQFVSAGLDISGAIADGFSAGFAGHGVVGAIESFTGSILSGLGKMFIQMAGSIVIFGKLLLVLQKALAAHPILAGTIAIAVGAAMMALGSKLSSASSGGGDSGGGGVGSSIAGAGTATNAAQVTNITLTATGASATSQMKPAGAAPNITVIGENDGQAQRAIINLINNGTGRGYRLAGG